MARVFSTKVIKARERTKWPRLGTWPPSGASPLPSSRQLLFALSGKGKKSYRFFVSFRATLHGQCQVPPPRAVQLQLQPANSLAILMAIVAVAFVAVVVWTAQPAAIMVRCCCFCFFLLLLRFFVSFFRFSFSAIICLAPPSSPPLSLCYSFSILANSLSPLCIKWI